VTRILNSTIAGNSTRGPGGAIYLDEGGPVIISSSIVADNTATDGDLGVDESNSTNGFEVGFSLIEGTNGNGVVVETPAGSNLLGIDPLLGPLQANGGPTQTRLPALTSPVVDAGVSNGLGTDQRGLARVADLELVSNRAGSDATDMGAVEIQAAACGGSTGALKIDGSDADDSLAGTDGPDSISGLGGNDSISAAAGNDCVDGGAGADRARGNGGRDQVRGAAGKDKLSGGGGKDKVVGAGGKDRLSGGGGKDKLKGGPGKDKIKTGGGRDKINCGSGRDKVNADRKDKVAANCETVT
jgi:Ca2+-binding RTX toxin-like protein